MISLICGTKKRVQINLSTKQKYNYRCRKLTGGRINWDTGIDIYRLLYIELFILKIII